MWKSSNDNIIAPGSILQHLFLKERVKRLIPGSFIEIGTGDGLISNLLLSRNWKGEGYDLNHEATNITLKNNVEFIDKGLFSCKTEDFLVSGAFVSSKVNLIISSMVLEHLTNEQVDAYFNLAKKRLKPGGKIVILVPSSPKDWGIEDENAGHYKRYTRNCLYDLASKHNLVLSYMSGLTYPLSNVLLPISNYLISKHENKRFFSSNLEKTKVSSAAIRDVPMKTKYPFWMKVILNPIVLYPFHILQKLGRKHNRALVLYAEFEKK